MEQKNGQNKAMRWVVIIVACLVFIASSIHRVIAHEEADRYICAVFIILAGFVFGAPVMEFFGKFFKK